MAWKPNARFDHIWVVVRFDHFQDASGPEPEERVTVTKAFWTREAAEADADRLNANWPDGSTRYFVRLARLERRPES